ncbi:hypothetical protein F-LCD7_0318 [Faustovirus]|nr:hypothetical protein F-LCD7_0318 [Faustovirus]QJX73077.1 nudix hydrolase domain protein [Faustovirus]QJX73584.1 hypothetical protein F-VV63_0318 [Faustovirus]SMH63578.1 Hypothetical protein FSTVLC9_96 [Faustovirus]
MSQDNSDVDQVKINSPDSLFDIFGKLQELDLKQAFLIFLFLIFVQSDLFYEHFLSIFDGALDMKTITNYGVIIQGVVLSVLFIISSSMRKANII